MSVKLPTGNWLRRAWGAESGKPAWLVVVPALAAIYFLTGKFGLSISPVAGFATLVWPPTGISLAALLLFGYRLWPGIFLGAFLVNAHTGASVPVALGIATGNTLEAVLGAYFLQRFAGFRPSLDHVRDVLGVVIFAALVSTTVSATIGVTSLSFGGIIPKSELGVTWRAWWVGDLMGDLIVAPLLLIWATRSQLTFNPWRLVEATILAAVLIVLSLAIFGGELSRYLNPYFVFPVLVCASLRFGQHGGITGMFVLSVIAVWGSARGLGPFRAEALSDRLLELQMFMGVAAITALVLGAAVSERKRALEALRQSRDELELQVQSRTAELSSANEALQAQIAEKKQTTQALRKSEEQARRIIDTALDAFVSMDATGVIIDWNPQAEAIFGWSRAEAIGRPVAETIVPPALREAHLRGLERFLKTGEGPLMNLRFEIVAWHRNGYEFPVEITISPVRLGHGYVFHAFVHDITDRRKLEKQVLEAAETERQRIAQDLHDGLCNHLAGIAFRAELAAETLREKSLPEAKNLAKIAGLLRDAIGQAHRLAKGLRPVIREPLGLMSALDELTVTASNLYGVDCRFQNESPIAIRDSAKAVHLYWIANEAVHNAIRHGKAKHVSVTLNEIGERGRLAITDDGSGLPDPLPKDRGLGLNIMQYRARMIGGALDVQRGREGGTVVTCSFPTEPTTTTS